LRFYQNRKRKSVRRTDAIPTSRQRQGAMPLLCSVLVLETQQLVGIRSFQSMAPTSTLVLVLGHWLVKAAFRLHFA